MFSEMARSHLPNHPDPCIDIYPKRRSRTRATTWLAEAKATQRNSTEVLYIQNVGDVCRFTQPASVISPKGLDSGTRPSEIVTIDLWPMLGRTT